jgi:hypothetical protein
VSEAERTFTSDEVQAIVRKRLATQKAAAALNTDVVIEMLRNVLERLDAIEAQNKK